MNDDELAQSLRAAMQSETSADEPSGQLLQTLVRTRVAHSRHPYLVPIGATAVVTALTAGGFVVANLQGAPTTTAAGATTSPTPGPTTAAAVPSSAPSAVATTATAAVAVSEAATPSAAASASAAATTTAAPTTTSAPTTTAAGPTTTTAPATTGEVDDSALFAAAASYSVTERVVTNPTLPDAATKTKTVTLLHNASKSYYGNRQELTWDDLAKLPTGPEAFRAAVKEPGNPPNAVEKGLQELVQTESPLAYPQRKAAMAVAMTMPGATVTHDAKDADGRPAVRVSIETDGMKDSYYFEPVSAHLLEASSFGTTPGTGYQVLFSDWTITPKT
jgi:hypothetical protein